MNSWWVLFELPFKISWGTLGPSLSRFSLIGKCWMQSYVYSFPSPKWKRCILFWFLTQIYWTCFSIIFFLFCERLCYSFDTLYADWLFQSQEPGKTKHPQLHYESKLYMLLQGGSECLSLTPPKKILYYNYQFLTLPICKTVFVIIHNSLPLNKPYNW